MEVAALRNALAGRPGIASLGFDLIHGTLTLDYDPDATDPPRLIERIAEVTGLRSELLDQSSPTTAAFWSRYSDWVLTIASGLALAVGIVLDYSSASWVAARFAYVLAIIAGGAELLPQAVRSLGRLRLDMHVLMTVAVLGAVGLGEWDEAATVAFLFGLSEAIEALSLDRARRAVRALLEITPQTAERFEPDRSTRVVPAAQIRRGDLVLVRAGERVPVDGRVSSGRSTIDQQAITGESIPVLRGPGDDVFAGTVNGDGAIEVEATRPLDDAVVSRIVERVRAAQTGRTPAERSIERFAAVYTPAVVGLALALMVVPPVMATLGGSANLSTWRAWFSRGLVLLVIACPCALVIGTPVAVVSALAAAARRGILIKGGQFLETFGRIRTLAFDKTGTLTRGEPDVVEVVPTADRRSEDVLRIAAALGDKGGHVLGRAIARHARGLRLEVPSAHDYIAVPGLGATGLVEATQYHLGSHRFIDDAGLCHDDFHSSLGAAESYIGTAVALTAPSGPLGWIRLADRPRAEAARVLADLRSLGVEAVMLTGDNAPTAAAIARELGIVEVRSNLLPEDKVGSIAELEARRGPAGMVGDGVNDAPALAAAAVSVAVGGVSSGAALETADIVLMADNLAALPWLVRHARRTLARIRQNITLAVGAKLVVLVLAVLGRAALWMAIAADLGVSLVVVANALRLLKQK
jgi:Cd2+/Zn2+-exporting ATPase